MADALDTKSALALTRDAKAAIQLAFEELGSIPRLVTWANSSPVALAQFYTQIWAKIIPKDVKAEIDGKITIEVVKFGEGGKTEKITGRSTLDDGKVVETTAELIAAGLADGHQD